MNNKNKIIAITGTTASGKTGLAVKLALMFNGEIISADSRQVYKYMDIGTGKDLGEYSIKIPAGQKDKISKTGFSYKRSSDCFIVDIPYHLISIAHPNTEFNLLKWKKQAEIAIKEILKRGRVPIIAGGTGLYLEALVDDFKLSGAAPDKDLRKVLEQKEVKELYADLESINKKFTQNLHESDKKNKRRLIRYIETLKSAEFHSAKSGGCEYDHLVIGLTYPRQVLRERIYTRLIERLRDEDMIKEVETLHKKHKISWKRLASFGLEYKFISRYLKKELTYDEMVEKLNIAIGQFAKRQMTWLRRWEKKGRKIYWLNSAQEAEQLVKNFLK